MQKIEDRTEAFRRDVAGAVDEVALLLLDQALTRVRRQLEGDSSVEEDEEPATEPERPAQVDPRPSKLAPAIQLPPRHKYDEAVVRDWLVQALRCTPGAPMTAVGPAAPGFPYPTMHQTMLQRYANKFEAEGTIRREGHGRTTRWFVAESAARPVEAPARHVDAPHEASAPTPGGEPEPAPEPEPWRLPYAQVHRTRKGESPEAEASILEALRERPRSYGSMKLTMFPGWTEQRLNQLLSDMRAKGLVESHPGKAGMVTWKLQAGVK